MLTIIKVFEHKGRHDDYEKLFLVDISKEQKQKIKELKKDIEGLEQREKLEKYDDNTRRKSAVEVVENYIKNNFNVIEQDYIGINCY